MPLSAFSAGHFRKLICRKCSRQLSNLLISSVVGKVQCSWEKKVSDSKDLRNLNKRIKKILTQGHQKTVSYKKCISHPDLIIKNAFSENKTYIIRVFFQNFRCTCMHRRMCIYVHICAYMGATPLHMGSPWIGGQCFFHHLFNCGNYIWHDSPLN